jgi:hypothetical protein
VLCLNSIFGVIGFFGIASIALAVTYGVPIDDVIDGSETLQAQRARLVLIGPALYLSGEAVRTGLFVALTVQLFRLRVSAIWLLVAFLLVDVATNISWSRMAPGYWEIDLLWDAVRYGFCGALLAYSYHLQQRGVLKQGKRGAKSGAA